MPRSSVILTNHRGVKPLLQPILNELIHHHPDKLVDLGVEIRNT